jgi:hypothetical protein
MNTPRLPFTDFINPFEAAALLRRLVANLRGFAYRRRNDRPWTIEWVSGTFRGVTGYDPHRFFQNQSLAFANLIHPEDRSAVSEQINDALTARRRTTVTYRITTAHHAIVTVEDRLAGVYDASGRVVAVEGIIDYAPTCMELPSSCQAPAQSHPAPANSNSEFSAHSDS